MRRATFPPNGDDDLFRMPVDRAFTIKGTGTVVTGTVWSGRVARDETVRIFPGERTARVRGIQGHGEQLDASEAGGRTAIALTGVDAGDVPRGSTLVVGSPIGDRRALVRADVTLVPGAEASIRPRTWFRAARRNRGSRRSNRRDARCERGEPFAARVVFDEQVLIRAGDRFVLRTSAPLNTIGGGVIVDPYPPRRARPWPTGLTVDERLSRLVDEAGMAGVDLGTLPVRLGWNAGGVSHRLSIGCDGALVVAGRLIACGASLCALCERLVER